MSAKYAQEMILIPKPSFCHQVQSGGQQVNPDTMDQFWQRRLLVNQLTMVPHLDCMMKLLGDMKGLEGWALPSTLLGQGPNSSDYFCLQGHLKNIPAQPVIRPLVSKPSTASAAPTTSPAPPTILKPPGGPPSPMSFEEAVKQQADLEKRLDEYKEKAKQEMEEVLISVDDKTIKAADYNWRIVISTVNDMREENRFDPPEESLVDQLIYRKGEKKRRDSA